MSETLEITAKDGGTFTANVARPESRVGPGLIVIQEIFGVNAVMRDLCAAFAEMGYIAVCPDLFWRQEPGIQLTDKTEDEWARAFELYKGFDEDKGVEDLAATLSAMRSLQGVMAGRVGSVGYCLGGKLAYLMATRTTCDASVGYYGVGIENALNEKYKIQKPLMLHVAGKDEYCPQEAQEKIVRELAGFPLIEVHQYPEQDHAFARIGGQHYNEEAANLANTRTAQFFQKHLHL